MAARERVFSRNSLTIFHLTHTRRSRSSVPCGRRLYISPLIEVTPYALFALEIIFNKNARQHFMLRAHCNHDHAKILIINTNTNWGTFE